MVFDLNDENMENVWPIEFYAVSDRAAMRKTNAYAARHNLLIRENPEELEEEDALLVN